MRMTLRALLATLLVASFTAASVFTCEQWSDALLPFLDLDDEWDADARLAEELKRKSQRSQQRIAMKQQIVHELIEERIILRDATESFIELNASDPELITVVRIKFAGANDFEKTARQVLQFVEAALWNEPQRRAMAIERLAFDFEVLTGAARESDSP